MTVDHGRLQLGQVGANDDLRDLPHSPFPVPQEFARRYGALGATRNWQNATLTPDFPTAGRTLSALWNSTHVAKVDGVVAVDPVTLAAVLEATGPVQLRGRQIGAVDVVKTLTRDLYAEYPIERNDERNLVLTELVREVFGALDEGRADVRVLAESLSKAAGSGHLLVRASDPRLQAQLAGTAVGGALPADRSGFLQVVTQNLAGGKLDTYLHRGISYRGAVTGRRVDIGAGLQAEEEADVGVRLRNDAPSVGLPEYVTVRGDLPSGAPFVRGENKTWVSVYLGKGAQLDRATLDGRPLSMTSQVESGLTVLSTEVVLKPVQTTDLRLHVSSPSILRCPCATGRSPCCSRNRCRSSSADAETCAGARWCMFCGAGPSAVTPSV